MKVGLMGKTALLVMDYQIDILKIVEVQSQVLLANTKSLIQAGRSQKAPVIYVQVAFRSGYPEVSPNNKSFAALKTSDRMLLKNPGTAMHPEVAPAKDEVIVIKQRVGPMIGTDLPTILRAQGIEHLVLAGISSSGVVLSTVRAAADLDFAITVVSDACADADEEVHRVLMEKIFPRQANVTKTETALKLFNS